MSVYKDFFKRAFLRRLAQVFPFPRGVNEIGLPMRDKFKRVFHPDEPEKMIQKRQKFDYGDVVEVLRNGSGLKSGSTGTVKGLRIRDDGDLDYLVGTDTEEKLINGKDLASTNKPKQMVSRPVFPIGSHVQTAKGTGYVRGWPEVGGYDYYEIDADDQAITYAMHVGSIKPLGQQTQTTKQPKFKRGDQIKIVKDANGQGTVGMTGVVDSYDAQSNVYHCYLGGYGKTTRTEDELELNTQAGMSGLQTQTQLKVGDRVMCTDNAYNCFGESGIIVSGTPNGFWAVKLDSGKTVGIANKSLTLVASSGAASSQQKFQAGDQVEVVSLNSQYRGYLGEIDRYDSSGRVWVDLGTPGVLGFDENDLRKVP